MWTTLIFSRTAAVFLAMTITSLWRLHWVRRLPALETFAAAEPVSSLSEKRIRCSVVIAARDEETRIEQTIRHLLAQRGVEVELPATILARRVGWSWRSAIGVPFMMPVFLYTLLNPTFVTLRQGGVRWRDTFYSIEALRAGSVR